MTASAQSLLVYFQLMDPITQGVVGASAALALSNQKHAKSAALLGLLGGMAPDLDIFIRSDHDPLLFLEFHRQFTHSLFFIPIGGTLVALVLFALLRRRVTLSFKQYWLFCSLGYATHAVLDACTTYGTLLLWPFSDMRVAWNTISVIDPIFTLPIIVLIIVGVLRRQPRMAHLALVWAVAYLSLGALQHARVETAAWALAVSRGHTPTTLEAKPSLGNILLWKTIYQTEQHYYVDAVHSGWHSVIYPGESIQKLDIERDFAWLDMQSQQAEDIERFRWFSNDYLAQHPKLTHHIIDIRYSMLPNKVSGLWGIGLAPDVRPDQHVSYQVYRQADAKTRQQLWRMLRGQTISE